MIIDYAAEKGLKLDESPKEVIEYIGSIDSEDIELSPEMLAVVSGGASQHSKEMNNAIKGFYGLGKWEKRGR